MSKKPAANAFQITPSLLPLTIMLSQLKPDPGNSNEHPDDNIKALKDSLLKYGQLKPIVIRQDGTIIAGEGTYLAAKELGALVIAAVRLPKDKEHLADEFGIADNQTARLSRWNPAKLKASLDRLAAQGVSPTALGFNEKDLQALLAKITPPKRDSTWGETTASPRRTKIGDLWTLGAHRLLVGDSRDKKTVARLMGNRKAQMVFTDPPYGVDYEDDKGRKIMNDKLTRDKLVGLLTDAFTRGIESTTSDAAFYIWHANATREDFNYAMKAAGLEARQYLIWAKPSLVLGREDYQWNHEPCFYASKAGTHPAFFGGRAETTLWRIAAMMGSDQAITLGNGVLVSDGKGHELTLGRPSPTKKLRHVRVDPKNPVLVSDGEGQGTVWEISRESNTIHPNQKPVELATRAIQNSSHPGQVVLDLFGGSGSTLMACEATGRAACLMEFDPRYADGILNRWEKLVKQKAVKA